MPETLSNLKPAEKKQKVIRLLKKIPLFAGLYDDEFLPLYEICSGQMLNAGETLFYEGDHSRSMFVLLSGSIALTTNNKGQIYKLMPGEVFGEIGMITQNLRSATAQASSNSSVLEISNADYNLLLGKHPRISSIIMQHIAESLAQHIIRMNYQK